MDVERDVVVEQGREHVASEVDHPLGGKVVEDLAVEDVDHAARQVGERLGPVGLLLEALDPAGGVRDHDAELAHVGDPLDCQRGDAVVGLVGGAQRAPGRCR